MLCFKFHRFFNATTKVQDYFEHIPPSSHYTKHFPLPHHAPIFSHIYLPGGQGRHVSQIVRQVPMKVDWWDSPLLLQDLVVSNLHYRYSEQSVCNLSKRRTRQPVSSGEIFENGWLRTAPTEQSEITACDIIQFLTMKISFGITWNVTFNVHIEFLKIATLEPILSIE